mgnify:CR=1 FL=1
MAFRANEPAGSVTMLDWDCSTTDANGQLWELYPGSAQIGSDGGDPVSPSSVVQSILYPNATHGGQQTIWPKNTAAAKPLREMYVALTLYADANNGSGDLKTSWDVGDGVHPSQTVNGGAAIMGQRLADLIQLIGDR